MVDTTAPVLTGLPADVTNECDAVSAPATPTATDNCDSAPTISFTATTNAGSCADSYTIIRTWTATDACNNQSTASQVVTVVDTTAPLLTGVPADATNECDAVSAPATPTASDNCDGAPTIGFTATTNAGSCADSYTIIRTWTATDDCGNQSTASQVVTVVDTTAPVLTGLPADATNECDAVSAPATPTATDNCDSAPTISFAATTNAGSCADGYMIIRTWTATDDCGNQSVASQIVTVVDTTPPIVTCPPALVLTGAVGSCEITVPTLSPTLSDNCDTGTLNLVQSPPAGAIVAGPTNLLVVLTATDACGNSSACTSTITVVCPPCDILDVVAVTNCNDEGTGDPLDDTFSVQITVTGTNVTTFSVSGDPTVTGLAYGVQHTILTGQLITGGAVNLVITDSMDTNCTTNITVSPPPSCSDCQITDVQVLTQCIEPGTPSTSDDTFSVWVYAEGTGVSTYAVSGDLTASNLAYGVTNLIATNLLISGGNLTIHVNDEAGSCASNGIAVTAPPPCSPVCPPVVIVCPSNLVLECGSSTNAADTGGLTGMVSFVDTITSGACPQAYTIERVWTETNFCGNADSCTQNLTVVDTIPPSFTCPSTTILTGAVGTCAITLPDLRPITTDNCATGSEITVTQNPAPGTSLIGGITQAVVITATDACGNPASCTTSVEVVCLPFFDLALIKTLAPGQTNVVNPGDPVEFTITVTNQGTIDATYVQLVDYPNPNLILNDPDWYVASFGDYTHILSDVLPAGASTNVNIEFIVPSSYAGGVLTNWAEIYRHFRSIPIVDIDSTPGGGNFDTPGETEDLLDDDVLDQDGRMEEMRMITIRR